MGSEGEEAFMTHIDAVAGGFVMYMVFEVGMAKGVYVVGDGEEG